MTIYTFFWLLVTLTLSLLLVHLRYSRKVAAEIEEGVADAKGILDSSTEGIITTDETGTITRFNLAAENIFGFKAHNVIGKSFLQLLPEESQKEHQHIMCGINPETQSHGYHAYELMARRSDGTKFPLAITVSPVNEHGKQGSLGMLRDITARMQAEANSRKSQQMMEFLLQASPVVFYTCNLQGSFPITYVSPNVEQMFGHKPETVTGAAAFWPRHIHPDDKGHIHSSRLSRIKSGHEELEYRLKTADGSYRWIADNRTILNDENGQPNLLMGCWTDIHDRKSVETLLSSKEDRLSISLKCANLVTWDWSINSGEITWFGDIIGKLGVKQQDISDFDDFIATAHPEDREALQEAFRHSLIHDKALVHEYRLVWPDKSVHWGQLAGELINDEAGSPVRLAGVFSDITAQKQLRVAPAVAVKQVS